MIKGTHPILAVILRPRLTLGLLDAISEDCTIVGNKPFFAASELGHFNGFYDWLFTNDKQLVGIQFFEHPQKPYKLTAQVVSLKLPYIALHPIPGMFFIYFGNGRDLDPTRTIHQEFFYNVFGRSEDGEYLMTFDTQALRKCDLNYLRNCGADWISNSSLDNELGFWAQ